MPRDGSPPRTARSTRRRFALAVAVAALAVSGCGAGRFGAGPPGPGGAHAAPVSIAHDCSRDVTAELQAWIDSVPDGSQLDFAPGGCYRIDRTLRIVERHGLTFDGHGATFRAFTDGRELPPSQARTRSQWSFVFGSNITVQNMTVRGANPNAGRSDAAYVADLEAQHGFVVAGTQNLLIALVRVYDTYGDFVYIGAPSSHVRVTASAFARNGRQGWTVVGGEDIVFDHNSISETRRATIDMEESSVEATTRHVVFSNNYIGPGRLFLLSNHGAAALVEDVQFLYNDVRGRAMQLHFEGPPGTRNHIKVIGNSSDSGASQQGGGLIFFDGATDVQVKDNWQPLQPDRGISGVGLANSRDVEVSGNKFLDAIAPIYYFPGNTNVHDVGNWIGNPLHLSPEQTMASN